MRRGTISQKIFALIALAGLGKNAIPETVADRAIMVEMRRMLPKEKIHEFESDEVDQIFAPVKVLLKEFLGGLIKTKVYLESQIKS